MDVCWPSLAQGAGGRWWSRESLEGSQFRASVALRRTLQLLGHPALTIRLQRWSMRHLGNALRVRLAMLKAACAGGPGAGFVAALGGFVIGALSSAD